MTARLPAGDGGSPRRPFVRLDVLHREILDRLLRAHALALPEADTAWLNAAWHRLAPRPDAIPGLLRRRARHFLAPLCNGNIRLLADGARRAAIAWDAILGAEAVQGVRGPRQWRLLGRRGHR